MFRIAAGLSGLMLLAACATTPSPAVLADLAPTGKLRVGINFGNTQLTNPATRTSAEPSGIAPDLARELGRRLAVPVEIIGFDSGGKTAAGAGTWDVAFVAIEAERAAQLTFTAAYLEIESSYLVPAGSSLRTVADVDREGIRIAVSAKGGVDLFLSRTLQRAQLVRVPGGDAAFALFVKDKLEAYAGLKPNLVTYTKKHPGLRVIEGRYTMVQQGVATAKGRENGARYLRDFVEDVKASGLVAQLIEKNGMRGLTVAPSARPFSHIEIGGSM